jgi:hypothetical protein
VTRRAATFTTLLPAIAVGVLLLLNWRSLPNMRPRDDLGPIPRFIWIKPDQRRPIPSIAQVTVASGLALTRPRDLAGQIVTRGCYRQLRPQDCLERNWRDFLGRFGATELQAGPGERAYRYLDLPSRRLGPTWTMVTLRVRADGGGAIEVLERQSTLLSAGWTRRTKPLSAAQIAAFERTMRWSPFTLVEADPRSLIAQKGCLDGVNRVFEAVNRGRYRYVYRRSCQADVRWVEGWGARLAALAG